MGKRVRPLLSEEQAVWYERLRREGFDDIEDHRDPEGPLLKRWHSIDFLDELRVRARARRKEYQERIDAFANDPGFSEILKLFVKHGNSMFNEVEIEKIWSFHRDGLSQYQIADEMECSRTCIRYIIVRMKEWMKLVI